MGEGKGLEEKGVMEMKEDCSTYYINSNAIHIFGMGSQFCCIFAFCIFIYLVYTRMVNL